MAKAAKKDELENGDVSGEYKRPDAKRAVEIFKKEIAPKQAHMATIKGDLSDPYKRIKDDCHFPRKVLDFLFHLEDMDEAKRDHFLLALSLGLVELKLFMPRDLVTEAEGTAGESVVPTGDRSKPKLVTVDEGFEASEAELAGQKTRPSVEEAKAAKEAEEEAAATGTGAAAIKAMKAAAKEPADS